MPTTTPDQDKRSASADVAHRIEALANSDVDEVKFFRDFVRELIEYLDAEAAAVWMLDRQGLLSQFIEVQYEQFKLSESPESTRLHVEKLLSVLQSGQSSIHAANDAVDNRLRTQHVVLFVPIRSRDQHLGIVELLLPPESPEDERLERLEFAEEMCVYAARYMQWRDEAGSAINHLVYWNKFHQTVERLHRSLDLAEVTAVAANDGRTLLGCDRVSIAVKQGRKCRIMNVSGQERVNRRSNLVRALGSLATAVVATGESLLVTGHAQGLLPPLERCVTDYLKICGSRMVKVIPLQVPQPLIRTDHSRNERKPSAFAALIIEQTAESWLNPVISERADLLASSVAGAMHNAQTHRRIFLLPLWLWLGRCLGWFQGRNIAKFAAVAFVLTATILTMAYAPVNYRAESTGKLMPVLQREAFAPWDGEVVELFVASGQRVQAGQPLARIRNNELNALLLAARNKLDEKRQLHGALKAELDNISGRLSRDEEIRLRGRIAQTQIEIEGVTERFDALQKQVELLTVRSPIAGTVATFQLEQLLINRPVRRGDVLMEIMDEQGRWHLELEIPERRMGHLLDAQRTQVDKGLTVQFVLATRPESTFTGRLQTVSTRSSLSDEHGTSVDATVAIRKDSLPDRRIGADVIAKIHCGQRSLAYVLFGDLVEFARMKIW